MHIEDLGKRALFLIPSIKVYNRKYSKTRQNVARIVHKFLLETFGGYTCASGNIYGYFTSESTEYDELKEFRVAFREDDRRTKVPKLQKFLALICDDIGEECIYLECGEDAMLVYPAPKATASPIITITRYSTYSTAACSCMGFVCIDQRRLEGKIAEHVRTHRNRDNVQVIRREKGLTRSKIKK